ncbi:MAG: MFS transporter [Mycobacteriaceae bacterium]|nr:MFS transporter [Mycobacteriaceae bacterium]
MGARNDRDQTRPHRTMQDSNRATPLWVEPSAHSREEPVENWRPSRRFVAAVVAIAGIELMAAMDGPIAVFALPTIQDELGLSDSGRSWVITAYLLTYGGLMLLGGRLGDTFGRKRTFIFSVALFTVASAICSIAWDGGSLVAARLLQGLAAAIAVPTCLALVATSFPKGRPRNAATAVFGAIAGIGAVMGLVVGGAVTEVWWRLAFLANVPIGLLVIYLAHTALRETQKQRMKLDAVGAVLATLVCTAGVFGLTMGPEKGWLSATTISFGVVVVVALAAFAVVERKVENPIVPFSLFLDRNRLATFAAMFLSGGTTFTLIVLVALYVQNIMGYSPLHAGVGFLPFAIAMALGMSVASRLISWVPPRVMVVTGAILMLGAILYGSTLNRGIPYFPNLLVPIVIGGVAIGLINVPLGLSVIASVGSDRIGPTSAIAVMLQGLGGPVVLAVIQAIITSRTLTLGGTSGPVTLMNDAQLDALDRGFTYGLSWLAGVVILLVVVVSLIGYTAQQVGQAQEMTKTPDAQAPARRVLLFVLGSARSGTSAITRLLSLCGGSLPPGIVSADSNNPLGYWEPAASLRLNGAILRRRRSGFFDPALHAQDEDGFDAKEVAACMAEIGGFLNTLPAAPLVVVKDLQITVLSDMWFEAARQAGFDVVTVIAVRHPQEVVESWSPHARISPELANALWLKYNLAAERNTRGLPRVFVEYENVLDDWRREMKRISTGLNIDLNTRHEGAIDDFLNRDLQRQRHCGVVSESYGTEFISTVYAAMQAAAQDQPWDESELDRVFEAYRASERNFRAAFEDYRSIGNRMSLRTLTMDLVRLGRMVRYLLR